ncbi:carboxypeptidase-like regulatory domain-containing protein [uncultured Rubinisphaera sp.]|uniref:carboxypeptidase-like regulatory domain-containing protein n=1 Tax=uncultured Rubinisphaera sp. TaxID=1678686 RepID=UPI0030D85627
MKNLLTGFACLSLVLAPIFSTQAEVARTTKTKSAVSDIALSNGGALNGKAVTGQGQALEGAKVSVRRNNEVVATTVTDAEGKFTVAGLDTGIYELQAGQGKGVVRAWEGSVAPPTSKNNVLIVSGATTRGQSGLFVDPLDTITLGLSITGVALGAAALSDDGGDTYIVSP